MHATSIQRGRARCEHAEEANVLWTPVLLHSERRDGVSRHVQLARLTSIRDCCTADPSSRAAWWSIIFADLDELRERGVLGEPDVDPRAVRVLEELARMVPFARPRARTRTTHARWTPRPMRSSAIRNVVDRSNCFEILGLARRCCAEDLKRAWRAAAAKHHPDRGGSDAAFHRVKQAYDECRALLGIR